MIYQTKLVVVYPRISLALKLTTLEPMIVTLMNPQFLNYDNHRMEYVDYLDHIIIMKHLYYLAKFCMCYFSTTNRKHIASINSKNLIN